LPSPHVAAIRLALISKVLVMSGGPGVGKTTIVNAILRILAAKGGRLLLCAPTGGGAKRQDSGGSLSAFSRGGKNAPSAPETPWGWTIQVFPRTETKLPTAGTGPA
jgi:hypothetical protein